MVSRSIGFWEALLNEAFLHFNEWEMKKKIEMIFEKGWGFEHWFQNELLVAYIRNGHEVKIRGKMKYDSDIVVDDCGIELKCWKKEYPSKRKLIKAFDQHPGANGYLFLVEYDQDTINKLKNYISNDYVFNMKEISEKYSLIMITPN